MLSYAGKDNLHFYAIFQVERSQRAFIKKKEKYM